jgi:hypothetical protein
MLLLKWKKHILQYKLTKGDTKAKAVKRLIDE